MINRKYAVALLTLFLFSLAGCDTSNKTDPDIVNDPSLASIPSVGNPLQPSGVDPLGVDDQSPDHVQASVQDGPTPVVDGILRLDTDYPTLLLSLAGYQLEIMAEEVRLIGDSAILSTLGSTDLESGTYSVEDQEQTLDLPVVRTLFACEHGGELTLESAKLTINELFYSRESLFTNYLYDQCQLTGQQVLNGSLKTLSNSISGRHFTLQQKQINWGSFSWIQDSGMLVEADATLNINVFSSFSADLSRQVVINNYSKTIGNVIVENLSDTSFTLSSNTSASGEEQEYTLNAQGRVINQAGIVMNVITDPILFRRQSSGVLANQAAPFSGQLSVNADDGSQLILTATSVSNSSELFVDVFYRDTNGQTNNISTQRLINLPVFGP